MPTDIVSAITQAHHPFQEAFVLLTIVISKLQLLNQNVNLSCQLCSQFQQLPPSTIPDGPSILLAQAGFFSKAWGSSGFGDRIGPRFCLGKPLPLPTQKLALGIAQRQGFLNQSVDLLTFYSLPVLLSGTGSQYHNYGKLDCRPSHTAFCIPLLKPSILPNSRLIQSL
ncbi:MAG: hypothetical protein CM15mP47_0030 [Methanobacteriota archaeon]|nr:MAG: hypothetical protein CM15mP47_0030 [Euryarchaeota archaeon]